MLRRWLALLLFALVPQGAALALPAAPVPATAITVNGSLLDEVTKIPITNTTKTQGIGTYNLTFHDDAYQYSLPLCADGVLVEDNGSVIDGASLIKGDTLVVTVRPNPAGAAKACVGRVVRQKVNRGASGGECLQDYQVKREIENEPSRLLINTDYVYDLNFYARPTLDCDRKTYGSAPITTVVAPGKPFTVTLTRDTPSGTKELKRWSLTTNSAGFASFTYTFNAPADSYKFTLTPASAASAGDQLTWTAKAIDPRPSPSTTPEAVKSPPKLSTTPIIVALVVILIFAGLAEGWHWYKKKRANDSPEQEYNRTPKL